MRDEIPNLTAAERALLERFRVDQSPEPAVMARVLRGLGARLEDASPRPIAQPWWLWLRAGGLSLAIAAGTLLVIGGTVRVAGRMSEPSPAQAADTRVPATTHTAATPATVPAGDTPPIAVPPPVPAPGTPETTTQVEPAAPATVDPTPARPGTRAPSRSSSPTATATGPVDAAAEIALFRTIKVERDAKARLAAIARYRKEFAAGAFVQEAAVLEIEALCDLGRVPEATERGAAFVRRFGDSAYAAVARRGCAEAKP